MMTQAQPDRLDRIEAAVSSITASVEHLLSAIERQQEANTVRDQRIQRLEDGQLALQELGGILAGETRQLKRAVDYLLSQDGER